MAQKQPSKSELQRIWRDKILAALKYLDEQPIELEPLITDCIVETENLVQAKEMFDRLKDEYIKKRSMNEDSCCGRTVDFNIGDEVKILADGPYKNKTAKVKAIYFSMDMLEVEGNGMHIVITKELVEKIKKELDEFNWKKAVAGAAMAGTLAGAPVSSGHTETPAKVDKQKITRVQEKPIIKIIDKGSNGRGEDHNFSGDYDTRIIKLIIASAKRFNVDPKIALAMALQESQFGKKTGGKNIFNIDFDLHNVGGDASTLDFAMGLLKQKIDKYGRVGGIQAFNHRGKSFKKKGSYYGIKDPDIDTRKNPIYAKRILDLVKNAIETSPELIALLGQKQVKESKYTGGYDNCEKCGHETLTTGIDKDKANQKEIKWYHKCMKCGHKMYIDTTKKNESISNLRAKIRLLQEAGIEQQRSKSKEILTKKFKDDPKRQDPRFVKQMIDKFESLDPSYDKIYTPWMSKIVDASYVYGEDDERVKEALEYFEKNKRKGKWPNQSEFENYTIKNARDIMQYPSLHSLEHVITKFKEEYDNEYYNRIKQLQAKGLDIQAGSELVHEDSKYVIIRSWEPKALMYYGKNTNWCTRFDANAVSYLKNSDVYTACKVIDGKLVLMNQFDFGNSFQFMDLNDRPAWDKVDDGLKSVMKKLLPEFAKNNHGDGILSFAKQVGADDKQTKKLYEEYENRFIKDKKSNVPLIKFSKEGEKQLINILSFSNILQYQKQHGEIEGFKDIVLGSKNIANIIKFAEHVKLTGKQDNPLLNYAVNKDDAGAISNAFDSIINDPKFYKEAKDPNILKIMKTSSPVRVISISDESKENIQEFDFQIFSLIRKNFKTSLEKNKNGNMQYDLRLSNDKKKKLLIIKNEEINDLKFPEFYIADADKELSEWKINKLNKILKETYEKKK